MRYKVGEKKKNDGEKVFRVCLIRKWKCLHWHQQRNFSISTLRPFHISAHSSTLLISSTSIVTFCRPIFPSTDADNDVLCCSRFFRWDCSGGSGDATFSIQANSICGRKHPRHYELNRKYIKRDFFRCTMNRQSNDKYLCALDVSSGEKLFLLAFQLQALRAPTHIIFNWIFLRFSTDKQALKTYENRNIVGSEKVAIKAWGEIHSEW